jgi:hypothetical protein
MADFLILAEIADLLIPRVPVGFTNTNLIISDFSISF